MEAKRWREIEREEHRVSRLEQYLFATLNANFYAHFFCSFAIGLAPPPPLTLMIINIFGRNKLVWIKKLYAPTLESLITCLFAPVAVVVVVAASASAIGARMERYKQKVVWLANELMLFIFANNYFVLVMLELFLVAQLVILSIFPNRRLYSSRFPSEALVNAHFRFLETDFGPRIVIKHWSLEIKEWGHKVRVCSLYDE